MEFLKVYLKSADMQEPPIDWNSLGREDFIARLEQMEYEAIEAIYDQVDKRHKACILRHCAYLIQTFMEHKDNLSSLAEIREYVRLLPIMVERHRKLAILVEEFRLIP